MKKRIIGLALLGMIMIVPPSQATFGGFRIGANFGMMLLQGRHFYTGTPQPDADRIKRLSTFGPMFGVHTGYLLELSSSKMVVGIEAYYFQAGASPKIELGLFQGTQEGEVTIQHNRSIGAAAVVGMMLNPKIMAYLNVGLEIAQFQLIYQFNSAAPAPLTLTKQTFKHKFNGLVPGLGVAYKISSSFLIGAELSVPFFKRFKARANPPRSFQYRPIEKRLMLKLTYVF